MALMPNDAVIPPSSDAIRDDLLCIKCQYNLRTRTPADRCPECGTPVSESVAHYKEHARAVVQPVMIRVAAWCLAIPSLLALFSFVATSLFRLYVQRSSDARLVLADAAVRQLVHAVYAMFLFAGVSILCSSVSALIVRPFTRLAVVVLTATYAVLNVLVLVVMAAMVLNPAIRPVRVVWGLAMGRNGRIGTAIICVALGVAGFALMRRLGASLASPRLVSLTNLAFPLLIAHGVLSLGLFMFLGPWRLTRNPFPYDAMYFALDMATAVVLTGLGVYWIVVAREVGRKLRSPGLPALAVSAAAAPSADTIGQCLAHRQ